MSKDLIEAIKRYVKAEAIFNVHPFMPSAEEELKQAEAHLDSFAEPEEDESVGEMPAGTEDHDDNS